MTTPRPLVVSVIGTTQTLAWASTYYLPAIVADPAAADLHVPREWFFGCFSASLLISGLLGPAAGRAIDRFGGRGILAATNIVLALGLLILSQANGLVGLAVGWTVLGLGMGYGLYEAAFATVTRLYGQDARQAITGITLIAGFASTIGWPASAFLTSHFGWRDACLGWVAAQLLIALPLNGLLVPPAPPAQPEPPAAAAPDRGVPWAMIILAVVFGATWFVSSGFAAHLPRLLRALGASEPEAIAAATLVGPAQVAARLFEFTILRRLSPLLSARLATSLHPLGAAVIGLAGVKAAVPFALLHGAGNGMLTIARGTLPLALFGASGYGRRAGWMSAPARILQGAAPLAFSFALDHAGPYGTLIFSSSLMAASCLALCLVRAPQADR